MAQESADEEHRYRVRDAILSGRAAAIVAAAEGGQRERRVQKSQSPAAVSGGCAGEDVSEHSEKAAEQEMFDLQRRLEEAGGILERRLSGIPGGDEEYRAWIDAKICRRREKELQRRQETTERDALTRQQEKAVVRTFCREIVDATVNDSMVRLEKNTAVRLEAELHAINANEAMMREVRRLKEAEEAAARQSERAQVKFMSSDPHVSEIRRNAERRRMDELQRANDEENAYLAALEAKLADLSNKCRRSIGKRSSNEL